MVQKCQKLLSFLFVKKTTRKTHSFYNEILFKFNSFKLFFFDQNFFEQFLQQGSYVGSLFRFS